MLTALRNKMLAGSPANKRSKLDELSIEHDSALLEARKKVQSLRERLAAAGEKTAAAEKRTVDLEQALDAAESKALLAGDSIQNAAPPLREELEAARGKLADLKHEERLLVGATARAEREAAEAGSKAREALRGQFFELHRDAVAAFLDALEKLTAAAKREHEIAEAAFEKLGYSERESGIRRRFTPTDLGGGLIVADLERTLGRLRLEAQENGYPN
jgi:hypothetical protein